MRLTHPGQRSPDGKSERLVDLSTTIQRQACDTCIREDLCHTAPHKYKRQNRHVQKKKHGELITQSINIKHLKTDCYQMKISPPLLVNCSVSCHYKAILSHYHGNSTRSVLIFLSFIYHCRYNKFCQTNIAIICLR